MIKFAHPEYLYALAILPVLIVLFWLARRWRLNAMKRYGNIALLDLLTPNASRKKPLLKFFLAFTAFAFLILAIANPQIGSKMEEVKREGVDIFICLDVSNSMKSEDIKPNRLESAKQEISRMLDKFENDRIGIVVFAGDSYLQLPLTSDYSAARLLISTIDVDIIPIQGTAIGSAIKLALKSFVEGEKKHKAIIVISDGENHEDDAIGAAKDATDQGAVIHTIGMGSPEGSPIPIYQDNIQTGFKKDQDGNVVMTKLDESGMQQIADAGHGRYIRASNQQDELNEILKEVQTMEKKEFGAKVFTEFEDRFQIFLGIAVFLLIIEYFLSERKNAIIGKWKSLLAKPFSFRQKNADWN